jgi:hypothetical protein
MATRKKTTKKTTSKKTTKKTSSRSNPTRTSSRSTPSRPPARRAPADLPPAPRTSSAPQVPVKDYVHMQQRVADFLKENPNGVYFHADAAERAETESALRGLDAKTPVFITSKKTFTATELQRMGFEVFQNGKDGKLVGIRK